MKLSFTKMQGCANDYIYLDCRTSGVPEEIADAFRGALGRETELSKAQTERLPVLRFVREIKNLSVLDLAAAAPRAQHGEVLAAPVGQLGGACARAVRRDGRRALLKVSTAGLVCIQAVLRDHEGEPAIDDGLAG